MGCVETVTGTDVSFNQKVVNWTLARERDDVKIALIRWTQVPWKDSRRVTNWIAAGVERMFRGAYVVYDPDNEPSGYEHALFFIRDFEEQIGRYDGELQVWVDVELEPLDWDELKIMCDTISAWSGRRVGIYTGSWFLKRHLPLPAWILNHDFWLTGYDNECGPDLMPGYNLDVRFWQRTSSWQVPWVHWVGGGVVDRTDWLGTITELWRYADMGEQVVKLDEAVKALEDLAFDLPDGPPDPPDPPSDFKLLWPTPSPKVVTQWYGINPQWYNQFGLPGHEGIDQRAGMGVDIYAAARGEVIRVEDVDNNNYGKHVRILHDHPDGPFKSVYAHFQRTLVNEGDMVEAGQVIGKADNTGNSSGSHLHLTLKKVGDGSPWMNTSDIVNPVPYFPDLFPRCTIQGYSGNGWRVDVGGNFRTAPVITNNIIRWVPAGQQLQALDFGGEGGDWWKVVHNGTTGWFWNPGYKLSAL